MEKFLKKHFGWIVLAIVGFMFVVSALNANNDSATFDEVAHIPAGYSYVTEHDTRLNPEHPPLIKDFTGFPLLFMNLNFDTSKDFWTGKLPNMWDEGQWAAGRHLLYEAGNDPDKIIFWSRIPIVILSVIFALFLFKWGREIGGILAGLFALTLFAFDPNILGHNHFVTTDLGIAAFLTFAFYYFLKFIKYPTWKNVGLGGLFLGLLLVTKFSSVVALPVFGMTLFIYPLVKHIPGAENNWKTKLKTFGEYLFKGICAFAIAAVVVWIVYKVNTYNMPKLALDKTIEFFFSANDSNPKTIVTNKILHTLNASDFTRPWGAYMLGPAWMFKRVSGGNGAYFLGQVGNGFTWYFPVVFMIKETLPFMLLALFALFFTIKQAATTISTTGFNPSRLKQAFVDFLRGSVVWYTMFVFIILYAFLSIKGGLNIGFRHLFPILPFAYLLITKKVFEAFGKTHERTKHVLQISSLIVLGWLITGTLANYPSYTSYFNESIGGSSNGYQYVTDSNTDWGQDLKRLKIFLDKHPEIDKIRVDYFGGGKPQLVLGNKYVQWWDSMRPVQNGWYAISTNYLQGSIYDKKRSPNETYSWTQNHTPVAMIGKSILIYHITDQEK